MPPTEDVRAVQALLEGLSVREVAVLCTAALRAWRKRAPGETEFTMHGSLGREIVPLLADRKQLAGDPQRLKEPFLYSLGEPWMQPVVEFVWWLVRTGLAVPLLHDNHGYAVRFRVTTMGERFLAEEGDHPLIPGFVSRVRARCRDLPDSVVAHLDDASACLDHALLRPAVVLLGLAYESAIEAISESLAKRGAVPATVTDMKAAKRISHVKAAIDGVLNGEERYAAHAACDFADALRRRRNDAAHTTPTFGFDDEGEIEELLVSAGRHLPHLWLLA